MTEKAGTWLQNVKPKGSISGHLSMLTPIPVWK
ncbi:Uncharacterised protein [Vibrio cholerae]|nr:Uncharacterised protein [Vibrio cholerae]